MRDFASELNAWNDWLASTTRTSPTLLALLGTSSAPEVVLETGDGLIRSLSAAATRLSEATRPANDLVAPVVGPQTPEDYLPSTLATSMACDLVRHLGGTWEHLRGDLSQLRTHKASSVAAMHALRSRLDELTSWVTENRRTLLDDLKPHFACRSIDSSFEDLVGQIGPSWRNAVSAVDMFTDYSARATEYCSQVTSFLQKLELRKGDFDSLREEAARVGRSENPDPSCPPVQPGDADALLTDYATLVQDARGLIDAGQRRMTCQRELTQQWATLRAQCEDLKALLTDYSTLSGDRHVLGARLDRLNNVEQLQRNENVLIQATKQKTLEYLRLTPQELPEEVMDAKTDYAPPSITHIVLSISADLINTVGATLVELTSRQAHLSQILSSWDAFEATTNEFESSLRTLRTSLMSYEHPAAETVGQIGENADLLDQVRSVLNETNSTETPGTGSPLMSQAIDCRQRYDQLDVCLAALRLALETLTPSLQLDASVVSQRKQAELGLLGVQTQITKFADAWRQVYRTHLDYETELADIRAQTDEFATKMEDLAVEAKTDTSRLSAAQLNAMAARSKELCAHFGFIEAKLVDCKSRLSALIHHRPNSSLMTLQQQIAGARERFDCSRRLSAQLVENCAQRIAADERLRATIAENATWLEDAEKQLETLRAVERFTGETFSPPLADMHSSSEPIFRVFNFSSALSNCLSELKKVGLTRYDTAKTLRTSLKEREKVVTCELSPPNLLSPQDAEEIATLRQRFKAYEARVSSWLQEEELAINAINELDTAFVTVLEDFTSYVEEFSRLELDSRFKPPPTSSETLQPLEDLRLQLDALAVQIKEKLSNRSLFKLHELLSNANWPPYSRLYQALADRVGVFSDEVDTLRGHLIAEIDELKNLRLLDERFVELHKVYAERLDKVLSESIVTEQAADLCDVPRTLQVSTVSLKETLDVLAGFSSEMETVFGENLSNQTSALKNFADRRQRPTGILLSHLQRSQAAYMGLHHRAEHMRSECEEQVQAWEAFSVRFVEILDFASTCRTRMRDLERTEVIVNQFNGLQNLSEELKTSGPGYEKLDQVISLSRRLITLLESASARTKPGWPSSGVEIIGRAIHLLRAEWEKLQDCIAAKLTSLEAAVLAREKLSQLGNDCQRQLDAIEKQLAVTIKEPVTLLVNVPPGTRSVEERLRRLGDIDSSLVRLRETLLSPLNDRIQQKKEELRDCKVDLSELNSFTTQVASLWEAYSALHTDVSRRRDVLTRLAFTYEKFTTTIDEEKRFGFGELQAKFETLAKDERSDCRLLETDGVRALTEKISKSLDQLHAFRMELRVDGDRRLRECEFHRPKVQSIIQETKGAFDVRGSDGVGLTAWDMPLTELCTAYADLNENALQIERQLSDLLLQWTAFDEVYTSLSTWINTAEADTSAVSADFDEESRLWAVPSSFLTIRSTNLICQLAHNRDRASEMAAKQAELDLLISRSDHLRKQLHEDSGTSASLMATPAYGDLAIHQTQELSQRFSRLTTKLNRHIEELSAALLAVEKLQNARTAYSAWERDTRCSMTRIQVDRSALMSSEASNGSGDGKNEILAALKILAESLERGDQLLVTCKGWAATVQSDVLAHDGLAVATNTTSAHMLVSDLLSSYTLLRDQVLMKQTLVQQELAEIAGMKQARSALVSWLNNAEAKVRCVIEEAVIKLPPTPVGGGGDSVLRVCEATTREGLTLLSALKLDLIEKEQLLKDQQDQDLTEAVETDSGSRGGRIAIVKRFERLRTHLLHTLEDLEGRLKELIAYREASELVCLRQSLAFERYCQACGPTAVKLAGSAGELVEKMTEEEMGRFFLPSLLSLADAERRLGMLRGLYDDLRADSRHFLELTVASADHLLALYRQSLPTAESEGETTVLAVDLSALVLRETENYQTEQAALEALTVRAVESLSQIRLVWLNIAQNNEDLTVWLSDLEQQIFRDPAPEVLDRCSQDKRKRMEKLRVRFIGITAHFYSPT
ncbi:hypothetical protein SprV_0100454900 [Sparganum proliferum]